MPAPEHCPCADLDRRLDAMRGARTNTGRSWLVSRPPERTETPWADVARSALHWLDTHPDVGDLTRVVYLERLLNAAALHGGPPLAEPDFEFHVFPGQW